MCVRQREAEGVCVASCVCASMCDRRERVCGIVGVCGMVCVPNMFLMCFRNRQGVCCSDKESVCVSLFAREGKRA